MMAATVRAIGGGDTNSAGGFGKAKIDVFSDRFLSIVNA